MSFREIDVRRAGLDPVTLFGKDWALLTAGDENGFNPMTVSWGHIGCIWGDNDPTAIVYVRPQRYTRRFMDRAGVFTLCFFDEGFRKEMTYMGTHSGRDGDKAAACSLTPVHEGGATYFEEARLVLVCRKIYQAPLMAENFVDGTVLSENYPKGDLHEMYIGRIERALSLTPDSAP